MTIILGGGMGTSTLSGVRGVVGGGVGGGTLLSLK